MVSAEAFLSLLLLLMTLHSSYGTIKERFARSPDSEKIRQWKLAFSDDLAPSGLSRLLPMAVSCHWALNELCLGHVSCRELWTLFRRNCAVDAQNQCRMANKNDCWQSFEGISWTGLGSCTCAGNHSDCHWIRLQTNYNKCIYELNHDADWHAQLSTAAQFSSRTTATELQQGNVRESAGVERWKDERQQHEWREQDGKETIRESGEEEKRKESNKLRTFKWGEGRETQRKMERMYEQNQKTDDIEKERQKKDKELEEIQRKRKEEKREKERQRKEKEDIKRKKSEEESQRKRRIEERDKEIKEKELEETQRKKSEEESQRKRRVEERRRRIAKEEERKRKYEEERKKRWREDQMRSERKKDEKGRNLTKVGEKKRVAEKQKEERERLEERREKQTNEKDNAMGEKNEKEDEQIRNQTFEIGQTKKAAATARSSNSNTTIPTDVPKLQPQHIWPTAESHPLVTQIEQPPPKPNGRTTTPMAMKIKGKPSSNSTLSEEGNASTSTGNSGSNSSSSCPAVLSLCERDEPCRWHLSELRIKCGDQRSTCERKRHKHCAQALHRFVNFVHAPLAQAMVFCTCATDDVNCRKAMFPFLTECFVSDQLNWAIATTAGEATIIQSQWTCTQTMKLCRVETDCSRRLSVLRSACPMAASPENASVVRCAIPTSTTSNPSLSACRAALTIARGSWLDEPCICRDTEAEDGIASCAELAEAKWPGHPCIGMVSDHFNQQFRIGLFSLETPTYTIRGNSLLTKNATNHRHNVLVHVGKLGEKGTMEMGEEVTVLTNSGRKEDDDDELATRRTNGRHRKKKKPFVTTVDQKDFVENGRRKEEYQWKWVEEEEKVREQKLENNNNNNGERETEVGGDGRGTDKADPETQRKRKNETELVMMDKWRKKTKQQLDNDKLKTDNDEKGEREAERQRKMRIHERKKTAKLMGKNDKSMADDEPLETLFITPKLPIEEGCRTRNVDGEWITHHRDTVIRHYHDWAGRCSSWCECKSNGSLHCHQIGCLANAQCEALHTAIGFGQRLYLEDRGACQCHDEGHFICDTSELMANLSAGLYITMGYSKAELDLIRKNVPKSVLETSGLISQSTSHAKDLAARVQFALERLLPEDTKCRVIIHEHFAKEEVLLLQIQWFGVEPSEKTTANSKQQKDNGKSKKAKWHSGKWEKLCTPYVRELELDFLLERAGRYQLLLSTIKQIRVIDLLGGLPPAAMSATSAATANKSSNLLIRLLTPQGIIMLIISRNLFVFLFFRLLYKFNNYL